MRQKELPNIRNTTRNHRRVLSAAPENFSAEIWTEKFKYFVTPDSLLVST
jgi:hypothetical protein